MTEATLPWLPCGSEVNMAISGEHDVDSVGSSVSHPGRPRRHHRPAAVRLAALVAHARLRRHGTDMMRRSTDGQRRSLVKQIRSRLEHEVDARSTGFAVWLLRRTKGRAARLWHRQALVLTTLGRRSGIQRTVPLQFFPDGENLVVVAANSGLPTNPCWYLNLMAHPWAQVEAGGRTLQVYAEELSPDEAARFWPRVLKRAPDYARYLERTSRRIPLIRLVARPAPGGWSVAPRGDLLPVRARVLGPGDGDHGPERGAGPGEGRRTDVR